MSKVPAGWVNTKLQNIAKIKSGSTPLRAKGTRYFTQNGTPWVKTLDLNNSEIHITDEEITDLALKETSCTLFPANTVLVAMYGGFNQIGRTGLITKPSASNQALSGLILNEEIADPKYVLNYLNGNVSKWKEFAASSRKDPNITRDDVCNFPILLPPLPEQTKIAQILSTWDKAIATTEQLIANSQQQKKALMQSLLTGKKRLPGFEGKWRNSTLNNIATIAMGSSPKSSAYNDLNIGLPLLQGNADINNRLSSPRIYTSQITRECDVDDILLSVRAPVGSVAKSLHHACIGRGIAAIKANSNNDQAFIYQWLLNYEPSWESLSQGSTFESVNSADIKNLEINLPPLPEQQKIAAVLTAADNEIELLNKKLAFLKQEKTALMQQLLTGKRRVKVEAA